MARDPGDQPKAQFGPFFIDVHERVLTREGEPVTLTPKAFDLLAALVGQPGRLVTKEDLLQTVWPDTFVEESNLAYNVFALRKALGDTSEPKQFIETVPKRGYRFTAALLPVNGNGGNGDVAWSATPEADAIQPLAASQPADTPTGATVVRHRSLAAASPAERWPWMRVVAGTALAVVLIGVAFMVVQWRREPSAPALSAQPLTSIPGIVRSPSLSPDGSYVAFTWTGDGKNNPDIYVQQVGAGSPLRLTTDPANDHGPSWSPDGRTIAFLRRDGSRPGIEVWLMAPLGGGERKLAEIAPRVPAFRPFSLGWCPDSQCLVVTDALPDTEGDGIVLIETASGAKRPLTFPRQLAADLDAAISPDGRTLIFRRDTTPFSGAFFRLSLDAGYAPHGDAVAITRTLSAGRASWTPDGRDILFGSRGALWRLEVFNGGEPTRLPFVGQDGFSPVVVKSANERQRLVYVRSFSDANIYRVDVADPRANASAPVARAIASTRGDWIPSLSPDGGRIAFLTDRSGESHIWTADVDGQKAMPLTSIAFASSPGFPRWSPDGRHIAFHGDPNGKPEVLTAPVSGGEPRSLTSVLSNGGYPTYSRDGKWIYFCIVNAGQRAIWKIPASGGDAVKVADNGTLAIESMDGRDLYYIETTVRPSAVWRLSLIGGAPVKVLDRVAFGNFEVVTNGIFFMEQTTEDTGAYPTSQPAVTTNLRYFDFATQRSVNVSLNLGAVAFGLTASADGKTVLFSKVDAAVDELMVVEDFR